MQSPCIREASQACIHGCCLTPLLSLPEASNPKSKSKFTNTVAASRVDFASSTTSSLFPNTQFTNPESLPSLAESFSQFTEAYPQYTETEFADRIRAEEYNHLSLSNHVCLDYIGLGLFSHSQQQLRSSSTAETPSTSSSPPPPPPQNSEFPFFEISYKAASLNSQILYGGQESELESEIRKRIMGFLNVSETEYHMVFTANRASAFKLLAESYPFQSNRRLLTVYDYESEAVEGMIEKSQKRGARVMSAEFVWPRMRIHSAKLRKMVVSRRKKRKKGLFVFPLQSRITGARYSYQWMNLAQENGWHVVLDACALGPKDMDTLGLSLFKPDFFISSFFKVFGENPAGFGCLFVKKSTVEILETSTMATSIGIVSLVPAKEASKLYDSSSSFSGPISAQMVKERTSSSERRKQFEEIKHGETTTETSLKQKEPVSSEIVELENPSESVEQKKAETRIREVKGEPVIECKGLDHADSLGLIRISSRARYLINWLVNALMKLQHPYSEKDLPLIRIYGPKIKFDRGPALAFNVFDWKGEKVEPVLVQKLADRSNISLSYGYLQNIWFSDKYEEEKKVVLEARIHEPEAVGATSGNKRREKAHLGITVVTATLGFLANFEDTYRLWAFVAQFLDADFVEKERWRYTALDQKIIEV
ncbi:hypothetical protein BVC80_1795g16 [Macleaya cordata]|uniref:Aminotransferase n=1 Tax=Macleaya cordata TaxID=56857 RepID=A0A200QPL6_MACCD|nr:hypothetical protein BVC80_1795g16 [Macleaya cordata]